MSLFPSILLALAPAFLLIGLGHLLRRRGLLDPAHVPVLNGLVIQVTLPALVVLGLLRAPRLSPGLALVPVAFLCAEAAGLALLYGLGRRLGWPRPLLGAVLMVGVFGNTSFIGYPVTLALLPRQFPTTILIDQFGMTVPMYLSAALLGAALGENGEAGAAAARRAAVTRFLRSPIFLSAVLGLVLRQVPVPDGLAALPLVRGLGSVFTRCLEILGQGTTPLVLLALGASLRAGAVRGQGGPLALACGAKLLLSPILVWGVCRALGMTGAGLGAETRLDAVLEAAMPSAVMASVLSGQAGLAGDFAVGVVFVTTVLSALTLPLLLTLLR